MNKQSIFVRTLGNSSLSRVMDYLITCRGLPVHQSDVIKNSHVSKATIIKIWSELIKRKFLKYDRAIGRAKLYKLNSQDSIVKKLIELYNKCLEKEAEAGLKEIEIPA